MQRGGMWTILWTAVAVASGIVIGEQLRGRNAPPPASPTPAAGGEFQLAQVEPGMGGGTGGGFRGGFRGGFGPGSQAQRFVSGRVESVDVAAGKVTYRAEGAATGQQTLQIGNATYIVRQIPGSVGDLRPGDIVSLTGRPVEMNVSEMNVEMRTTPDSDPGRFGGRGPGGGGGGAGQVVDTQQRMRGRVTSVNPLKIAVSETLECLLRVQPGATITRELEGSLKDVRPGDQIRGFVQSIDDGLPTTFGAFHVTSPTAAPRPTGAPARVPSV